MSDLKLLGRGRTADVFVWAPGHVLKLFHAGRSADEAAQEARLTCAVYAAGLPVPQVEDMDIVEHAGRYGFVCEQITGPTLLSEMTMKPWTLFRAAHLLAELQVKISACSVPGLPSQRKKLQHAIASAQQLSPIARQAAQHALAQLPDGTQLCHGDFHPDNVMLTQRGPVILDWAAATCGNALGDVMRTSMLLRSASPTGSAAQRRLIQLGRALFHQLYLRRYLSRQRHSVADVNTWALPIYAARLKEGILDERDLLERLVNELL